MTEHTQSQSNNVLRIVDGLHAGASRVLADEEMILVGSGEDCDIVLADDAVAAHHALISLVGGRFLVRALDAPVKVGGQDIHPGDPVELSAVQQVRIGEAVVAFGRENDPAWDEFVTVFAPNDEASLPRSGFVRKLPWIGGIAALSLASLAIFAAVLPAPDQGPDQRERLTALLQEHRVTNVQITDGAKGGATVTGAVDDSAALERLRTQVRAENIDATLQIRTGEHIAGDVAEMFRGQSIPVQARYIGNGDVEVVGDFKDGTEIERLAQSRAIADIPGVQRILPRTPTGLLPQDDVEQSQAPQPAHIVQIVRGENPHLLASDGRRFLPGEKIPGKGELVAIGEFAHVLGPDGTTIRIIPGPPPAPEEAADMAAADGRADGDPRFASVVANVNAGTQVARVPAADPARAPAASNH
ncbi:MAG: FHA domain-containing protein [Luteimonas sp.]